MVHLSNHAAENLESSDYLREGDVGFKKPKVRFPLVGEFLADSVLDEEEASLAQSPYRDL